MKATISRALHANPGKVLDYLNNYSFEVFLKNLALEVANEQNEALPEISERELQILAFLFREENVRPLSFENLYTELKGDCDYEEENFKADIEALMQLQLLATSEENPNLPKLLYSSHYFTSLPDLTNILPLPELSPYPQIVAANLAASPSIQPELGTIEIATAFYSPSDDNSPSNVSGFNASNSEDLISSANSESSEEAQTPRKRKRALDSEEEGLDLSPKKSTYSRILSELNTLQAKTQNLENLLQSQHADLTEQITVLRSFIARPASPALFSQSHLQSTLALSANFSNDTEASEDTELRGGFSPFR